MATARRSVTMMDLEKFEQFRRKFDPSYANKTGNKGQGGTSIKWPSSGNQGFKASNDDDGDDLYN